MITGVISVILNILLSISLIWIFGLGGIAFATAISLIFRSLILALKLDRQYDLKLLKEIKLDIVKIVFASVLFLLIVYSYNKALNVYTLMDKKWAFLHLVLSLLVGVSIYLLTLKMVNIKIVNDFVNKSKKIVRRGLKNDVHWN